MQVWDTQIAVVSQWPISTNMVGFSVVWFMLLACWLVWSKRNEKTEKVLGNPTRCFGSLSQGQKRFSAELLYLLEVQAQQGNISSVPFPEVTSLMLTWQLHHTALPSWRIIYIPVPVVWSLETLSWFLIWPMSAMSPILWNLLTFPRFFPLNLYTDLCIGCICRPVYRYVYVDLCTGMYIWTCAQVCIYGPVHRHVYVDLCTSMYM